jgi:hypothetical protein
MTIKEKSRKKKLPRRRSAICKECGVSFSYKPDGLTSGPSYCQQHKRYFYAATGSAISETT